MAYLELALFKLKLKQEGSRRSASSQQTSGQVQTHLILYFFQCFKGIDSK